MTRNGLFTLLLFLLAVQYTNAQDTYTDDFETYTAGEYVTKSNTTNWRTWGSTTGGVADDAKYSDLKAASGKNSILIRSTVAAGGPTDLVLKIGGNKNDGIFRINWNMYVEKDKQGYFNFQSTVTPGTGWALDFYLYADGKMQVVSGTTPFTNLIDFPVDDWFNMSIDVDLFNNLWYVNVDGECKAVFRSALTSIGGINYYANAGSSYFIDDVSYTYQPDDNITFGGGEAGLLNLRAIGGLQIEGQTITTATTIYNAGSDTIKSIEYTITSVNGVVTKTQDLSIAPKKSFNWYIDEPVELKDGDNNVRIEITKVNGLTDFVACNNFIETSIFAVKPAEHRKVLLEEGTGTWCGWCPRGAVFLDAISPLYDDYIIPIAVHNGDIMTVPAYDANINLAAYPNMVVDRRETIDPSLALMPGLLALREEPDAVLTIGAKNGDVAGTLDVSVSADMLKDIPEGFGMIITVVQDSVSGTTSAYNQFNYYANNAAGQMGGYESLPNPVPAAQMIYRHVARTFDNSVQNIPAAVTDDQNIYNYNITLDSTWDIEQLKIVAVLLNAQGQVSNANDATLEDAKSNGFVTSRTEKVLLNTDLNVYPNPAKDIATVELTLNASTNVEISLVDVQGKTIMMKDFGKQQGKIILPISLKGATPGVYTAIVRTNEGIATKKIVVQ